MTLAIIGAGMAGLACADRLAEDGIAVRLFDKGRGPGGRMSTRRVETAIGTASFDHGAQYFTVRDPLFRLQVDGWAAAGVAVPWPEAGADAWIGNPAMNAPIRHMAGAHRVDFLHHVHGLQRDAAGWWVRLDARMEGPFDAAIVALVLGRLRAARSEAARQAERREALRAELQSLRPRALCRRAEGAGVSDEALDAAEDDAEVIELIMRQKRHG